LTHCSVWLAAMSNAAPHGVAASIGDKVGKSGDPFVDGALGSATAGAVVMIFVPVLWVNFSGFFNMMEPNPAISFVSSSVVP